MKSKLVFSALLISFILSGYQATAQSIKQFDFMLGNWEMKAAKGKITESWKRTQDSLSGKSYRHQANGDSILLETLVIKKINGEFYYCSKVNGQNNNQTVNFKLQPITDNRLIFENKAHDFPQRIIYQNQGKETLLAWIEGEKDGKPGKSVFNYQRSH